MHQLTRLSLKNRALIALVTIVAAVFGLIGMGSLKQELMPSVQFPAIAVITSYPGASPEVVNNDVSQPIETALRGVPNLETTTATSSTGASMVLAEFTYGVDIAATEQKVERAVSRLSKLMPPSADTQVVAGSIDDFPVIQIAVTPAEGETIEQTAALIESVAIPPLGDIAGIREAQLTGIEPNRITIEPWLDVLAENGLSPQSISDTLQQSGVLMAAGTVTDGSQTLAVQAGSTLANVDDVAALPITGTGLTIGAVADVRLEAGPTQSISRVNGEPALTIAVTKMSAANTVEVSHAVQDVLADLEGQLGGANLTIIFDQAPYIEQEIHTLTTEGLLGLLFAVLVILVFLMSVRATLVTAISIPVSVLLTFVGLNFADYTLNMLTLGALTISIGRVVDDSIVVIENIKRHLTQGADRASTIILAVREVAGAITASTVTTVAVFLPMAFVSGMVGELFRPFAFTVTIALAASLLVSLTIVPVLAFWFLKPENEGGSNWFSRKKGEGSLAKPSPTLSEAEAAVSGANDTWLQRGYRPIIEWTLRGKGPAIALAAAVGVFVATMALAATPLLKTNFMGDQGQNAIGLVQKLAPGTSLDQQLAQAEKVEEALAGIDQIDTVQVTIGSAGGGMSAIFGGGGDGSLSYSLTTDPDADQAALQDTVRDTVNGLEDAGELSIGQSGGGMATSNAIQVTVSAPDQETLSAASDAVFAALQEQPGLKQVESDLSQSRPYLSVVVDRGAAAGVGLSETAVAAQLAQQMQPQQIGQITVDSSATSVYLQTGSPATDQAGVAAMPIMTAIGPVPLDQLATVQVADGPVTVRTADGARTVTVSALAGGDDLGAAGIEVNAALESVELPAGASATIGGVMAQQSEAFGQLGLALLIAILIVYVVMVATFRSLLQPLLLLISVPFAATGALLLLVISGIPLGVASLIGVLMLIGIVVTNAIVLIDLVNQYRDRGEPLHDAVLHGSLQRLRPIVMTALATILALTPMGLGLSGKSGFISQPLAVVVIGGLLSSTVLTLIVLPTLYFVVERARENGRGRRTARRRGRPDAPIMPSAGAVTAPVISEVAAPVIPEASAPLSEGSAKPALDDPAFWAPVSAPVPEPVSPPVSAPVPAPVPAPVSIPEEQVTPEPGVATRQMDLALGELGFAEEVEPEAARQADAEPELAPELQPASEPLFESEPVLESEPESVPAPVDLADSLDLEEILDLDALLRRKPAQSDQPVQEMNWDELMWQATQDAEAGEEPEKRPEDGDA